jgi:hypothetical protein
MVIIQSLKSPEKIKQPAGNPNFEKQVLQMKWKAGHQEYKPLTVLPNCNYFHIRASSRQTSDECQGGLIQSFSEGLRNRVGRLLVEDYVSGLVSLWSDAACGP